MLDTEEQEMDILLSSFVNKYIDTFVEICLNWKIFNFCDEIILNYYNKDIIDKKMKKNKI